MTVNHVVEGSIPSSDAKKILYNEAVDMGYFPRRSRVRIPHIAPPIAMLAQMYRAFGTYNPIIILIYNILFMPDLTQLVE